MALTVPGPFPEFGIIFRPLDNAAANDWVTRSRERFGMRMLSRKEGFAEALKILRRRGNQAGAINRQAERLPQRDIIERHQPKARLRYCDV